MGALLQAVHLRSLSSLAVAGLAFSLLWPMCFAVSVYLALGLALADALMLGRRRPIALHLCSAFSLSPFLACSEAVELRRASF